MYLKPSVQMIVTIVDINLELNSVNFKLSSSDSVCYSSHGRSEVRVILGWEVVFNPIKS